MRKVIRILLLIAALFAIYAGIATQMWSNPIGIIGVCFIFFLGTLRVTPRSKLSKSNESSFTSMTTSASNNGSSSSDCGSSGGDC